MSFIRIRASVRSNMRIITEPVADARVSASRIYPTVIPRKFYFHMMRVRSLSRNLMSRKIDCRGRSIKKGKSYTV